MTGADLLRSLTEGVAEGRRGVPVQRKAERAVWRLDADGRTWYAKRGVGGKRRELRAEAEHARFLAERGLGPEVLACGERSDVRGDVRDDTRDDAVWLVTAAAPGADLATVLRRAPAEERRRALAATARAVRALHDGGCSFPDLTATHVFTDGERAVFIDAARLRPPGGLRRGPVGAAARAEDLAALLFSLPFLRTTRADRVRLVRDAVAGLPGGCDRAGLRDLFARIDRGIARLAGRTRWRHGFGAAEDDVARALGVPGDDPRGVCDALLGGVAQTVVRTLPDRENRRLGVRADGAAAFHVKAYPPSGGATRRPSPAAAEIAAIDRFARSGVPVNAVAGWAEDVERGSAVVLRACAGEPLDDVLRRGVSPAVRRSLARGTARIWRRMRDAGLRHRDAYACHVFVATAGPGRAAGVAAGPELRVIDLARAGEAPWPRERWFVKDAAQLWHGVRGAGATRTDAVRRLRAYLGPRRLAGPDGTAARRFARRVAAKEASIAARAARKARRDTR